MSIGDFTAQAEAYHRSRPGYPSALLDELTEALGLRAGDSVADIGAGTGILTRLLAERGLVVSAVEPNEAMRSYATEQERVRWVDGTFEDTHLDTASQRWAVAAQALHWADPPRALPEVARVLASGASFTAIFNDRDHTANAHAAFVRRTYLREVPGFDEAYRDRDWAEVMRIGGVFGEVSYREVPHVVVMSRERYLQLWRGHNRLNNIAGPERFDKFFNAVETYLDENGLAEVPVAYRARAWTAQKTG